MKNIVDKQTNHNKMADHTNIFTTSNKRNYWMIPKCFKTLNANLLEYIIVFTSHLFICVLHRAATVVSARRLHRATTVVSARRLHQATMVVKGLKAKSSSFLYGTNTLNQAKKSHSDCNLGTLNTPNLITLTLSYCFSHTNKCDSCAFTVYPPNVSISCFTVLGDQIPILGNHLPIKFGKPCRFIFIGVKKQYYCREGSEIFIPFKIPFQ